MPLSNAILGSLRPGDIAALRPLLKVIHLEQKTVLFEPGEPVELVYFPIDGVISLVVTLLDGQVTEAAMVGNDGVVGASSALDGKIAFSRAIMQLSGSMAGGCYAPETCREATICLSLKSFWLKC
jgi:CRP-like cAMP-binding protein